MVDVTLWCETCESGYAGRGRSHCPGCHLTWTSLIEAHCSLCHGHYPTVTAFERHLNLDQCDGDGR